MNDGYNIIKLSIDKADNGLIIHYEENGTGIVDTIEKYVFDSFFTTK